MDQEISMSRRVLVALGSNLGDRSSHLRRTREHLASLGLVCLEKSQVHDVPPYGDPGGRSYLNQVLLYSSPYNPWKLLELGKDWERSQGRVPSVLNGPRPIDVDLLAFEGVTITSPCLTLPHPRLGGRAFLLPLIQEIPSAAKVLDRILRPQEVGKCLAL